MLFNEVVAPWRSYMELFSERPDLDSAAFGVSNHKFHWHNFYYMRAVFLRRLAEPKQTAPDRFYYEKGWVREMPADLGASACSGSAPVFGRRVAKKGVEVELKKEGQNKAFQVLGCSTRKVTSSAINKAHFYPRAKLLKERVMEYRVRNDDAMTLADFGDVDEDAVASRDRGGNARPRKHRIRIRQRGAERDAERKQL